MKGLREGAKIKLTLVGGVIAIIAVILFGVFMKYRQIEYIKMANPELARAMEYEEVKDGDEALEETENVEFDAFFLRDINQDGYAESIRGTCKEMGQEDTLYMEINVKTAGYLKDGKIEINGENFYLQTALPKDNELKDNYIGSNIKTIEFNDLNNGTQKMVTGVVRSGDYSQTSKIAEAIGNNINNYSKVNNVVFTGIYVGEDGVETPIREEYTGSNGKLNYDEESQTFTLDRTAVVDEDGNVTSKLGTSNSYGIRVVYPIEAYETLGAETITLKVIL